jgi:glycine hydroxymethyltransferase
MSSLLDLAVFLVTRRTSNAYNCAKAVAFGEALQDEFFTYALNYKKMLKQWQKRSLKRYDIISGGTTTT